MDAKQSTTLIWNLLTSMEIVKQALATVIEGNTMCIECDNTIISSYKRAKLIGI